MSVKVLGPGLGAAGTTLMSVMRNPDDGSQTTRDTAWDGPHPYEQQRRQHVVEVVPDTSSSLTPRSGPLTVGAGRGESPGPWNHLLSYSARRRKSLHYYPYNVCPTILRKNRTRCVLSLGRNPRRRRVRIAPYGDLGETVPVGDEPLLHSLCLVLRGLLSLTVDLSSGGQSFGF